MTLANAIQKAYLLATGKPTAPTAGSTKYNRLLGIINIMQDLWQAEAGVRWNSLYSVATSPDTVTTTDTFQLPTSIRDVSKTEKDYVRVNRLDGGTSNYTLVNPEQLSAYPGNRVVARVGNNLKFSIAFPSDSADIGGSISVPGYTSLPELTNDTDVISVDDPNWLVYMTAAEYVRNDITKQNQYGNLIALAQSSMDSMKANNSGQIDEVQRPWSPLGETWQ